MAQPIPGTPSLMRAINDRAALALLLERGPLTRPQIATLMGISKPTASQLLLRLKGLHLVVQDGLTEGGPGRTAELYRINPLAAHVAGLDVTPSRIVAEIADITGTVVGEFTLSTPGRAGGDVVARVRSALEGAMADGGVQSLARVVIGIQGAINPATGRLAYAAHIPGWHIPGLVGTLRDGLGIPVDVENDVNLSAMAEKAHGAAQDHDNFVLLWADEGIGVALVINGRLHRGATGGAGEVGYMPVPGAPTTRDVGRKATHGLQALAGGPAVRKIMRSYGFRGRRAADAVRAAAAAVQDDPRGRQALRATAERLATGLSAITAVADPELIILTGGALRAGGEALRALVEHELHAMTIPRPGLRLSAVEGNPVLAGALDLALSVARDEIYGVRGRPQDSAVRSTAP